MTNNPSENTWHEFLKTSKTGPSVERFIAEFFQFFTKIIERFVLSGQLEIRV